ncbi:MAG: ABC transporter permease, partial [Anaerolineales bacterium]|nr:ABC transporter permease [Anaerolineales bacterium]
MLFGFASGAFSRGGTDPRLPVGFLDEDHSRLSRSLHDLLAASEIIRLEQGKASTTADLENLVAGEKLAAAIIVPSGYGHKVLDGKPAKLTLIADSGATAGMSVESEALAATIHLDSAVRTAMIMEQVAPDKAPFDYTYQQALVAWQEPPIRVTETTSSAIKKQAGGVQTLSHTSPGMMLQFAIAGLLTCAQILVTERRSRCLQRLLTTATSRLHILLG